MKTQNFVVILFFINILNFWQCQAYLVDDNPYRHRDILDKDGRFQLEWLVDWNTSRVHFNVTVETNGYVGLGLSRKGKMSGADIVIGGVLPSGQAYFSDRHAVGNNLPVEDKSQDWTLHSAWERGPHTFLSFSRKFYTCDEDHDLPIEGDVIGLLWAFGEKDDQIEYHYQNKGVYWVYLLDPDLTPRELQKSEKNGLMGKELGEWKVWRIEDQQIMAPKDTTYLCSIHKTPENRKQHIVGFRTLLPTEVDRRHVHHFLLHRCIPPDGQSARALYENLVGRKEECYMLNQPFGEIQTQYCTELIHVWGVGGKPAFFPEHVGFPLYPNEYLMLQVHFNNPEQLENIRVNHALEIFYTDKLRQHDLGILAVGHHEPSPVSLMIPPMSLNHQIYGHCAQGCLESMLPRSGINVIAGLTHTHTTGLAAQILHLRKNRELPWILYDNNYNFNFQQTRMLHKERKVLPGDSLLFHCQYRNTDRNGNITFGGFSSSHEMCSGPLWYYPKIPGRSLCRSEIRSEEYKNFLQIYNTTWSNSAVQEVVTSPRHNAGLLVSQVGNEKIQWTIENRNRLQNYQRHLPQTTMCPSAFSNEPSYEFESVYPKNIVPYEKPGSCSSARNF